MRPTRPARPPLDHADVEVAVLDRPGEVALLEGRAHGGVLALGHPAAEHQRLGAAADAGAQRADEHLVRTRAPAAGAGRISPRPGSATQNADAVTKPIDMHRLLNRNRRSLVRRKVAIPVDRGHGGEVARVQHRVHHRLGPANAITAVRALLTLVLAVLVVRDAPVGVIVALATVALVTDALDGQVARRTGTVSRFGARFDMETDAALLLVLSLYVARDLGLWVLAIGLARYVFWAASVPLPWLRGQAPPRHWCKVVAALQGVVLVVAASGLLPVAVTTGALLVSLALLTESFAHEAWDLWRLRQPHRPRPWATRVTGLLACLVVWAVLVAPDEIGALSPAAFARIPVEGLVLVGLVLLLPVRPAAWLATGAGLLLGVAHPGQAARPRRLGRLRPPLRPAGRPGVRRRRGVVPPRRPRHGQRLHRHRSRRAADGRRCWSRSRTPSTARRASPAATARSPAASCWRWPWSGSAAR